MRSRQPDVTREKILAAAYQEIYRHGFQAASLSHILARTGLTKGALYHHFPDKHRLGHAVIEEVIRAGLDTMVFAPLREADDPLEALREMVRTKAEKATPESVKLGCPLNNLMQEMSPLDARFRRRLNGLLTAWHDALQEALQRAQKAGRLRRDVDCRAAALFIVAAWEGCTGIAKNLQSVREYRRCMKQLDRYIASLMA